MSNQNTPSEATQTGAKEDAFVDATGLRCPLPLLKAKQALNGLKPGQTVRVLATDKGSVRDFHTFAELSGHTLLSFDDSNNTFQYLIRKSH